MREIEVKAKIRDKVDLLQKFQIKGCTFGDPVRQDDSVYVKNIGSLEIFYLNRCFLRIRVQNDGKTIFTVKRRQSDLVSLEHEVEVNSKDELEQILFVLGFKKAVQVRKTRIISHCGAYEVCIDDVEGLGSYVEVEIMTDDPDTGMIQNEMFKWLTSFGVHPDDRVTKGYDVLMIEKSV